MRKRNTYLFVLLFSIISLKGVTQIDSLGRLFNLSIENKSYREAVRFLDQMIMIQPNEKQLYLLRGDLLSSHFLWEPDSAIADYAVLIRMDSLNPLYYQKRAEVLRYAGCKDCNDRAAQDYIRIIGLDSFYYPAYEYVGTYYYWKHSPKASYYRILAMKKLEEAVAVDSANGLYWYWLGKASDVCHMETKQKVDPDKAFMCYDRAIRSGLKNGGCYFERGVCYYYNKQYDKCIADMDSCLTFVNATLYYDYIELSYEKMGDLPKAIEILKIEMHMGMNENMYAGKKKELEAQLKAAGSR